MIQKLLKNLLALFLFIVCNITLANTDNLTYTINGINGAVKQNVLKRLEIEQSGYATPLTERNINALYLDAPENIRTAMKPYGYFKVHINSSINKTDNSANAIFDIMPGPIMPISHVSVKATGPGKDTAAIQTLLADFPLKEGDPFITKNYQSAKDALLEAAEQHGFIHAQFSSDEIIVDMETYSARIVLHLDTGEQFYFGDIQFEKTVYSDAFLERFLNIKKGEPYSAEKLLTLQENLSQSSFFDNVSVNPHTETTSDHHIPVDIVLTPSKSRRYSFGIGYGTYTELRTTASFNFRHLTNTGHHASLLINTSKVQTGITGQYIIPGSHPLTDQYILAAQKQRQKPNDGTSDYQNISAAYQFRRGHWQYQFKTIYQQEKYQITDDDPSVRSHVLMPGASVTYNQSDKLINPSRGYKISLDVRGADQDILSDATFLQTLLSGRSLYPINKDSRLITRGTLGVTKIDDLENLPLSLRYFAGGTTSMRGFTYQTIGPGRYLKLVSAEYQHRIIGDWFGAAFIDMGSAANELGHSLDKSIGPGIVYLSPIGSIQLSYAKALTKDGQPWRLEFNIGTTL